MGLLDFIRQRETAPGLALNDNSYELAELSGRVSEMQGRELEKNLAYQDYAAWQNLDENGSFFGPEFSIRATAPRIKALFVNEPWVYATATLIAKTLAGIPLKAYRPGTDEEIPNHPVSKMILGGSIYQSGKHQQWSGYLDLILGGNMFLVVDQFYMSLTLAPVELVSINLGDVNNPGPTSITIANPSKMGTRYLVPYERVVHLRLPNPNNPFYGLSPFAAASRPLLLDRYKNEFEMAFYLRGATNNGVIETTQDISKQRFERLMRSFEQAYTGKRNWWRTLFLPKGAVWKSASPTMKDMEHLDGLKENRKTVLAVLGIPPAMVGLTEDVNYATSEAQQAIFYQNTIIPMVGFIEDAYNNSQLLKKVFRGQVEIRADLTTIRAIQDQGELAVKGDIANKISRFYTVNEIRQEIFQMPPRPDGDVYAITVGGNAGKNPDNAIQGLALPDGVAINAAESQNPMVIQTLIFSKLNFKTAEEATKWAHEHGYSTDKVDETGSAWRLRQRDPSEFIDNSFRTVQLTDGVTAIMGKMKGSESDNLPASGGDPTQPTGEPPAQLPGKYIVSVEVKAAHHMNILTVETSYGRSFLGIYNRYLDNVFTLVQRAIKSKQDVRQYLHSFKDEVQRAYLFEAMEVLRRAQQRGYSLGLANTKGLHASMVSKASYTFTDKDAQAIDVLAARGKAQREADLKGKAIDRFEGFNATRTEQIMSVIETGYEQGQTLEDMASDIRANYDESYGDQAYTIARTEVLSAMSSGIKAYNDDLQQVFTDVQKEWVTVGDSHVRDEHDGYEGLGPVDVSYEYAPGLMVPRDYNADPGQVINCRCSLVNSIPSSATSRASAILDSDTP